jgi:hypothetical protein
MPEFMGPPNCLDGEDPDAMINDFSAFVNNTQDTMHHVAIFSGTRESMKHMSRNKTYIWEEQLHALELSIVHGIKVHDEGLDGKRIFQMNRCTGSQG